MKSTKEAIRDSGISAKLVRAVVRRIGRDSIEDVNRHGIDGGFGGFIYYTDTVKFWKAYKPDILEIANRIADDLGQGVLEMIRGFNCLGSEFSLEEIGKAIYGGRGDSATTEQIQNAMAWFAAEDVCRAFED
jgi:hypothetical protein